MSAIVLVVLLILLLFGGLGVGVSCLIGDTATDLATAVWA
jgi:hypothetical protein